MFNVADLTLPNFGKLERLWILPQQETVTIPPEVREDPIGYIGVRSEEQLQQVELLEFIPRKTIKFATQTVNISQLQPLDTLFDTLDSLQKQVNLRQWLTGLFAEDWQPIATIMAGRMVRSLANNAANTISRGKIISWQINNLEAKVILVLKITDSTDAIDLCLQLYPDRDEPNLPTGLSVQILDETGEICLSATAKDSDDWMQLEFICHPGEKFQIELNLAGITVVEHFSI